MALSRRGRTSTVSPTRRSRPIVSKAMLPAFEQGAERALRPAQQRLDPGDDFAHGERLDQIVVGAGVETRDAMLHGVTRRQHEDGNGVAPGAHVLQQGRARRRRAVRDRG